ncbi:hypothetical protein [Hyphomicrobium sulfonivorans]|uniref:hypothetical protein n=1 Tax=Hyphomicrobium sulfonivorans TaxID=121290 RepID=UPI00156F23A9|nr:hypothetical protein [Hyphomicrobium sulfonivorans]MBI1650159.1 hypothetical protein [Hyphomicrobium sulfonivorans]NSL73076.1 hypothetical protein [Hyphomicrobium sulfonivorans]
MHEQLLEYSSWSFQLAFVIIVLYLVLGLIKPSLVLAAKRSTVVVVSVIAMLLAATAFYVAVRPLDNVGPQPPAADIIPEPAPAPAEADAPAPADHDHTAPQEPAAPQQ